MASRKQDFQELVPDVSAEDVAGAPSSVPQEEQYKVIPFGSSQHAALLGLGLDMPPEEEARRKAALNARPVPSSHRVIPWHVKPGRTTVGGWKRRGRGGGTP